MSEHFLLEEPVAVCVYFTDSRQPHTPAVAVAGGGFVFIYRNLRPYFKFSLPALPVRPRCTLPRRHRRRRHCQRGVGPLNRTCGVARVGALRLALAPRPQPFPRLLTDMACFSSCHTLLR